MSLAEHPSRPFPVFAKLAVMLHNIPALQFVFARVSTLLRSDKGQPVAVLQLSAGVAIAMPGADDPPEREKLIRRRWTETGIKIWNPNVHGVGLAALNIQGRAGLLAAKPGNTLPRYDKLEFKLVAGHIVCEGVVVDPPKHRKYIVQTFSI